MPKCIMIVPRFAFLRGLLRPKLLPSNYCACHIGSHTTELSTPSANDGAKTGLIRCLIDQGIPAVDSEEIVSVLPTVNVDQEEVHRTLNCLNSFQFGNDRLVHLLKTHPGLILTSANLINKCYTNLSSIFTQNYVYKVLTNSPNVVEQKRSELANKINFLNSDLNIPNAYIVNSSALSHPIFHLKLRSEFLKRCGLLKPETKKRDQVMTVTDLGDMFDTSDEQFATKVAQLTPKEYEAFTTLYSMEVESDSEDEESDSE